jgi:hypothetical protein
LVGSPFWFDASAQVTTSSDCVLQSERVFLRKFRPDEANLFFDLDSDPEVMRFITKGVATPLALIENEIMPRVLGPITRPREHGRLTCSRPANFLAGSICDRTKLNPKKWNSGIA